MMAFSPQVPIFLSLEGAFYPDFLFLHSLLCNIHPIAIMQQRGKRAFKKMKGRETDRQKGSQRQREEIERKDGKEGEEEKKEEVESKTECYSMPRKTRNI